MKVPDVLNPLVGAWRLISWTSTAGDGTTTYPYGERAKGQLVYTPSGRMSAQLMRPDADFTRLADLDGMSALRELGRTTYFAYWGSYEVDDPAGTVTHHVEGSLAPSWVGTTQVRGFRFQGKDRLLITTRAAAASEHPAAPDLTEVSELIWERDR